MSTEPTVAPAPAKPLGRPPTISGRRVTLYLDEITLAAAAKLGDGNVSKGIRIALMQK